MPTYLAFNPNPRRPLKLPPPKSVDSQFHVLGPLDKYPIRAGAALPDADRDLGSGAARSQGARHRAWHHCPDHDLRRRSFGGARRSRRDGSNYRGCANALVFAEADDAYLAKLHDAGVRGARFSFRQELGAVLSDKDFTRAIARIRELGWYVKIQPEKDGIVSSVAKYEKLDVPVLIDHMARPDPARGKDDPNLRKMLELLSKGNFWVMLSLGEKTSKAGPPWTTSSRSRMRIWRRRPTAASGERLAAPGVGRATARRCRFARASISLRAGRGGTAENSGDEPGKAIRIRKLGKTALAAGRWKPRKGQASA